MTECKKTYDLEDRTAIFGEKIIILCKNIPNTPINTPLISQIIRSATSVGANYMEANSASSKKDFINKIHICKKEIQETKHWLRMLRVNHIDNQFSSLEKESQELTLIFGKILSSSKK